LLYYKQLSRALTSTKTHFLKLHGKTLVLMPSAYKMSDESHSYLGTIVSIYTDLVPFF